MAHHITIKLTIDDDGEAADMTPEEVAQKIRNLFAHGTVRDALSDAGMDVTAVKVTAE